MRLSQLLSSGPGTSRPLLRRRVLFLSCCLIAASGLVRADIYKSVDAEGRVTYSNLPSKGAKRIEVIGDSGNRKSSSSVATPSGFPKVDTSTQKSRDSVRKRILGDELTAEEKLLAEAQSAYKNGNPDLLPGEQANTPKFQERLNKLRQSVTLHEKNIIALKQELGALK